MMNCFYPYYGNDPMLKHEITFGELVNKLGTAKVYSGTAVDTETQTALNSFFELDRLCDAEKKFLFFWRRRLNLYYPIYKQELEMWAERKTEKWFFDNIKKSSTVHDGTFALDETTKAELKRTVEDVIANTFHSDTTGKTTGHTDVEHSGQNKTTEESSTSGDSSDKSRAFNFRYPEANYTGGVIPYDLDNNPNIEFIDSQADSLKKNEHSDTSNSTVNGTDSYNDSSDSTGTSTGTVDNKTDETRSQTTNQTQTGSTDRDTVTHWTENYTKQGDNLNQLANELIEQLPTTNFFLKLISQLSICFQTIRLEDEEMEDFKEYGDMGTELQ